MYQSETIPTFEVRFTATGPMYGSMIHVVFPTTNPALPMFQSTNPGGDGYVSVRGNRAKLVVDDSGDANFGNGQYNKGAC